MNTNENIAIENNVIENNVIEKNILPEKEKAIAVVKYCLKHKEPIQACCPEVTQYFKLASGTVIWSNVTGKRTPYPYDRLSYGLVPVRGIYEGIYVHYIPELDAVEVAHLRMDGGRGKDGERKSWEYRKICGDDSMCRRFFFRNDTNVYYADGRISTTHMKYYNKDILDALSVSSRYLVDADMIELEMKRYDEHYHGEHGEWGTYDLKNWYQRSFIKRGVTHVTTEVIDYNLDDSEIPNFDPIDATGNYYRTEFAWFQKVDDKYAVIRLFRYDTRYVRDSEDSYSGHYEIIPEKRHEFERVFISSSGKPIILGKDWSESGWYRKGKTTKRWHEIPLANPDDISEWKPLSYIKDIINIGDNVIETIITLLRHPIVETLYKSGYKKIAKELLYGDCVKANLRDLFGMKTERKGSLYKVLGVNKYTLKKYEDILPEVNNGWSHRKNYSIREIKRLYNRNDISDLSKELIDMYFPVFTENKYALIEIARGGYRYYGCGDTQVDEEKRKLFIKICKLNQKYATVDTIRILIDILRTNHSIETQHGIDIYNFHNVQDLMRIHDALVNIQNREQAERQARYNEQKARELEEQKKLFKKLQKDRVEKYEYEDDKFCIRMPKEPTDLITEGSVLSHCVGGYVDQHATGKTDIIFLRHKEYENIPFYTIEIHEGRVVQIHGKNNRWLGNNPEAIPFVYEWLNKIGAKYDKKLLLNLGTGYSASPSSLPETYLLRHKVVGQNVAA